MSQDTIDKLNKLVSKESSNWLENAKWRRENRVWLNKSAKIAIIVLRELRAQKKTQKDLADSIGVSPQYISKIVKGQENLSLETICKIESALNISLIEITDGKPLAQ